MKSSRFLKLSLLAVAASVFASCYYDPYTTGYGYGGGSYYSGGVSFVHTSSDRWFYDPAVYCYYDRHKRCYYDPWLGGYYPVGYCPKPIYGARHPYGWNGRGVCPTPRGINDRYLDRGIDRVAQLRARNYAWADNVRLRNEQNLARWQQNRVEAASNYRLAQQNQQLRNQAAAQNYRDNLDRQRAANQAALERARQQNYQRQAAPPANGNRLSVASRQESAQAQLAARQQAMRAQQEANRQRAAQRQAQTNQNQQAAQEAYRQRLQEAQQQGRQGGRLRR